MSARSSIIRTPLTQGQRRGFWAAWSDWTLDGMDAVGAGVNFLLGWAIQQHGSLGAPVAYTALAFILGLPA